MQARRTFAHSPQGGWSAVAVHLAAAPEGKEGFYLTLFHDSRAPSVVFLRTQQLSQLVEMAGSSSVTDMQLWDYLAKIPIEPLLPSRGLSTRLRAVLADFAGPIREAIKLQN